MSPSIDSASPQLKLKEHEKLVWSQSSGPFLGGAGLGKIFLSFGLLFFGVGLFPLTGNSCGARCNWLSAISAGPGILFALIGGLIVWQNMGGHGSAEYYLTNYRLVEARAGKVVGQVPRKLFKGEPTVKFLAQDASYDMDGSRIYNVSVHDPDSGEVLMRLTDMRLESVETLADLGKVVCCEVCGYGNRPEEKSCQSCGTVL